MLTNILILTESPFSKRDYDRFGVELLSQHFRVSILDCTPWLKPDVWNKFSAIAYRCPGYASITDMASLVSHISSQARTVAIDYLGGCTRSKRIWTELKNRNIPRAIVHNGLLPNPIVKWTDRIGTIISSYTPLSILKKLYRESERMLNSDPVPEIALMSGAAGLKDKRVHDVAHKIWAHSFDYDIYLESKAQMAAAVEPYAVFLDEDMVYHSDYAHSGIKAPTTARTYYASMNAFFENLERYVGMPITIAAHPRSRYDLRPQLWNGRTVIYGKTAQLVRDATLVLCHQSTSVSFAVLWRKHLLFLTTNDLARSFLGPRIAFTSTLLGASLINVDGNANQLSNLKPLLEVNKAAYAKYTDEYIKRPGTPELPVWKIFTEYVQRELL